VYQDIFWIYEHREHAKSNMSLIPSVVWSDTLYLNKKLRLKVENFWKYESSRWPSIGGKLWFLNVEPQVET